MEDIPVELDDETFQRLFKVAEIAKYNLRQRQIYRSSEKNYNDYILSLDTYFNDGFKEGIEKGLQEGIEKGLQEGLKEGAYKNTLQLAEKCLKKGLSVAEVVEITKLSVKEIEQLLDNIKNKL